MLKPFLQLADDGVYELLVEGVISGEEWWGDEFTPDKVRDEIVKADGKPIRIIINSPGGEVFAGAAIYNALLQYSGRKTVRVDGVAASMASVIAMVGSRIEMSPGSTMMIHRPSVMAWGNVKELNGAIKMLEALEDTILPIYENRTGLSKDEVFALLDEETWLSPEKAIELGFADSIAQPKQEEATAFEKIKAMLGDQQFAVSMSAMHKSLEAYVSKEAPKAEETLVETEEVKNNEVVVETTPVVTPEENESIVEDDDVVSDDPTTAEEKVENAVETKPTNKKKERKVKMTKVVETEMVVEPIALADPAISTAKESAIPSAEYKKQFVEMLSLAYNGDKDGAEAKASELKAQMVIDGTSGEPLYGSEVLARDIRQAYSVAGRVGSLVNRIDIEGAETFKQLVESAGTGFTPVALGGTKSADQPVWTPVTFEPHEFALIVAWLDGVQKRSPIAIYNQIVRYIAREYAKLEDKIVLTWEGGTFGGEAFPQTGLVPDLEDASRFESVATYTGVDVIPAIGAAYGAVESDSELTLVANRATWGALATAIDEDGRAIFSVVGEQVAAGALGTFRVVQSEVLEDGDVVIGAFDDYNLVTRGGLSTLFSREATVGELNLFTSDASALRADVDITGKAVAITSFYLLQFPGSSS